MIEQLFRALHHYNEAYRELINEKAMRHTPDHGDFEIFIQTALKLTRPEDWGFICSSMDIINDSLLGIEHFCKYGLDGPTKYDDFGEKFIRLYGVLNATYIQQQALLNLHRIANVMNLRDIESKVAKLQVREVRKNLARIMSIMLTEKPETLKVLFQFDLPFQVCAVITTIIQRYNTLKWI